MTPTTEHAAMARERNDSGRYVETVGPDAVLGTFDAVDGPVITSTDVSEYLECTTEAARQKLKRLVDDETLARRRTGRTFVYWRTAETTADESAAHTPRERSASQDDRDTTPDGKRRDADARAEREGENHREVLRAGLSGSGDLLERRVDAILSMYDYLREHGEATNDELQALADPDVVDYAHAESVWSNMVKGKDTLQALPGVEKPGEGRNAPWKYRGDGTDA